ncbi:MAG TPA: putative porin [Verrucomicrobiae bacterium]|jgi:hypothetical protein|nr:putative porin [Verrucomicrobiae bacterium]
MTQAQISRIVAGILLAGASAGIAHGESSDALLKKLVEKGILTTKEADELESESKNEVKKDWVRGAGLPDWVTSMKLYGDFRGRFEQNNSENSAYYTRDRFRYRLRLGLTTTLLDNFELGFRVASGNPQTNPGGVLVGGQPITANQDLNSLESRKFLWIDAAYAKWTAIKNDTWTVSGTVGKMDNPFQLSNMIWDYDIVPEGAALQTVYNVNEKHALKLNAAAFVLDELNQGDPSPGGPAVSPSHDPYLFGGQALFESKWTPDFDTSVGVAAFTIDHKESLSSKVQPFYNAGNTRDANGFLANNFNPIIGSASATYKFGAIPIYPGKFPVKIGGEVMENPAADNNNEAWRVGFTLGKAGRKGAWELNYRYQHLEADAWFDALVDDDNGAYYAAGNPQLAGSGKASGWFGGTNVKGHQVVATYSITDFMNFTFIYYNNELIINTPGQTSEASHFMGELNWRF